MNPMSNMRSASSMTRTSTVEVVDALLPVVDQAARRSDQQIDVVAQALALLFVVDAAVDGLDGEAGARAEQLGVLRDLHRELARRRDHAGARRRPARRCALVSSRRVKTVIRKAAVLPVPVCA